MSEPREATRRLLTIDSWLMAVCALLLYFSLEVAGTATPKLRSLGLIAEIISIGTFITALIYYTTAASCLCAPYYEQQLQPISERTSMIKARSLLIRGTCLLFWGLAALIPLSLNFHWLAIVFTPYCAMAPAIWLIRRESIAFKKAPRMLVKMKQWIKRLRNCDTSMHPT